MQVILQEDVPALGKAGEVVKVSEGHGRNFLLPRKKAVLATPGNLKRLESERQSIENKRAKGREAAQVLAMKISTMTAIIEKQAGEEGKIFGSVSTAEISRILAAQDIEIDRKLIRIKEPLRQLGEHTVEVHLHGDVVASLKIEIKKV